MMSEALGSNSELRVLLVSPVRTLDPLSGDVTLTEQLLACPPPGVTYTPYDEALADGTLTDVGSRRSLREARGPGRVGALALAVWRKGEHLLRRSGLAYREPLRFLKVRPGAFDLVHVHVFHTRFFGETPPIVMSGGGPMAWLYADAWNWNRGRIALANAIDRTIGKAWDGAICAMRPGRITRFIAPNGQLREHLIADGWDADQVDIIPNLLAAPAAPFKEPGSPRRLGFVAKDFRIKGGPVVLSAFEMLRRDHPELELLIVGSPPLLDEEEAAQRNITWLPLVDRQRLLDEIFPSIDILVYPSMFDTGVPYSTLEPLSHGVPAVVSDYRGLPDLVEGGAGRVARAEPAAVAAAVEELLDPDQWIRASHAATERFRTVYAAAGQGQTLAAVYRSVLDAERPLTTT